MTDSNVAATFRSPRASSRQSPIPGWRRKNNRLEAGRYVGHAGYSLTIATQGRAVHFQHASVVRECERELLYTAEQSGFAVLAYVFKPDHLHLLIAGEDESRLPAFTKLFKQKTGFHFKRVTGQQLWQKSYHDHILRREEDLNDVARYIAGNPVTAGLAEHWWQFPFWGGVLLETEPRGDLKVAATSEGQGAL